MPTSLPSKSRFLDGLTDRDRAMVVAAGRSQCVVATSVIVHQGDPAECLYLVTRGCARYFYVTPEGKKIMLMWVHTGEIFGATALVSRPSRYLVSAEMVKDGCLLAWTRSTIRTLAVRFPQLLENALALGVDYLTWYVSAHTSLICDRADQRVARVLVTLADGMGHKGAGGVTIGVTNEEVASMANITPFTASRILNRWQRLGAISKKRGQVLIRDPEQLFRPSP